MKMGFVAAGSRWIIPFLTCSLFAPISLTQDLAPRAYIITPVHSNAVTLSYSFFDGTLTFDGTVPITGATARFHVSVFNYSHSLNFFGRSANFLLSLPYGVGNFRGNVVDAEVLAYRSGFLPASLRFSVNIKGGPAMNAQEFSKWNQKTILGVSVRVVPLTGQYDPTKLINLGTNRWAFKPELGYSRRWGHWLLDGYGGAWFYTTNPEFFSHNQFSPGTNTQSQSPIGSFEGHISYDFKPRLWVSLDGNYWFGGRTSLNGVQSPDTFQRNSRVGFTASVPLTRHQSLKFSYNNGAYIKYGGNFQNISIAWQYSWSGRPN
jgi:Putative MetA-pathway of phenol degradation